MLSGTRNGMLKGFKTFFDNMMIVVKAFYVSFRILFGNFLSHDRKTKFQALGFSVGLRYRKSSLREETSRCQPVI